jgi:hypothetical protein
LKPAAKSKPAKEKKISRRLRFFSDSISPIVVFYRNLDNLKSTEKFYVDKNHNLTV